MTSGYSEVSDVLSVEAYLDKPFMAYFFVYQSDDSLPDNEKFSLYRIRGLLLIFSYRAISEAFILRGFRMWYSCLDGNKVLEGATVHISFYEEMIALVFA